MTQPADYATDGSAATRKPLASQQWAALFEARGAIASLTPLAGLDAELVPLLTDPGPRGSRDMLPEEEAIAMETILLGRGSEVTTLPREIWEQELAGVPQRMEERLAFMTEDHRRVRYLVVGELPRQGVPLASDWIARELDLPPDRVVAILDDLERNLLFLTRNAEGAVAWAYPLTVEHTPHHLSFRSGERLYAA